MAGPRVLIVLDNPLAKLLELVLQNGGYESRRSSSPAEFTQTREQWAPHIALIDFDLHPEFLKLSQAPDGRRLPALVLTRSRKPALKLHAFQEGAEDVLRIPILLSEIVARLYAVMRRSYGVEMKLNRRLRLDSIEVDLVEELLHVHDREPISLTLTESTLLYLLAANAGELLDREAIVESIWDGVIEIESNAVDRHIRDLRVKLGDTWAEPRFIETVPGKGYRWRHKASTENPN